MSKLAEKRDRAMILFERVLDDGRAEGKWQILLAVKGNSMTVWLYFIVLNLIK